MRILSPDFKLIFLGRYGLLLSSLVLIMLLSLFVETQVGEYLLEAFFIAVLFAGLKAIQINKGLFRLSLFLILASIVFCFSGTFSNNYQLFIIGTTGRALFLVIIVLIILFDLFRKGKVTGDTLAGAVSVYLLLALIWGYFFLIIEHLVPESFSFTQGQLRLQLWLAKEFFPFFYFSLVTITTVGYGDMSPVTTEARMFATFEAIVGQVYLTILVARLVGMYLITQEDSKEP